MSETMDDRRDDDLDAMLDRGPGHESWTERFVRQGGTGHAAAGQEDPELVAERRAFYMQLPLPAVLARIEQRRSATWGEHLAAWARSLVRRPAMVGSFAAAAAVAAVAVVVGGGVWPGSDRSSPPGVAPRGPDTRIKGAVTAPVVLPLDDADVSLDVQVRTASGVGSLVSGGSYRTDDQLQFRYASGELTWVWLGSIDAQGNISAYYPEDGARSLAIVPGRGVPLPGSVALDDYVGVERFFAVFSRVPVEGDAVRAAARQALREAGVVDAMGRLPLEDTAQASFLIRKVAD